MTTARNEMKKLSDLNYERNKELDNLDTSMISRRQCKRVRTRRERRCIKSRSARADIKILRARKVDICTSYRTFCHRRRRTAECG